MKKRQTSVEVASVLLDAHNMDQKENLRSLLKKSPAKYQPAKEELSHVEESETNGQKSNLS